MSIITKSPFRFLPSILRCFKPLLIRLILQICMSVSTKNKILFKFFLQLPLI